MNHRAVSHCLDLQCSQKKRTKAGTGIGINSPSPLKAPKREENILFFVSLFRKFLTFSPFFLFINRNTF